MGAAAAQVTSFVCVSESICGKPTVTIHTIDRLSDRSGSEHRRACKV